MIMFVSVWQRFAAVIMRIREPRTTALVFSSGKMVCTGAKRSATVSQSLSLYSFPLPPPPPSSLPLPLHVAVKSYPD